MNRCDAPETESARGTIRRAYYAQVTRWVEDYASRLAKGEWESSEDFWEAFDEETDNAMIYTADAYETIYASENSEDARDELVNDLCVEATSPTFLETWAMLALRLDIREHFEFPDVDAVIAAREEFEGKVTE